MGLDDLKSLLGIGATYAAGAEGIKDAQDIGREGYDKLNQLGSEVSGGAQFQPFTVTTGQGSIATDALGGYNAQLSPELQAAVNNLRGKGMGLLDIASAPVAARTNEIYGSLEAARAPQRERERMALEERLFSQGRTGVQTNQYGGTPEALALEKALAEQSAMDSVTARQQAFAEQGQMAQLGRGLFSDSFTPQAQLLNSLTAATPLAGMAQQGQLQGNQLQAMLGQTGVESLLQGQTVASNLQQQQLQGLLGGLFGQQADSQMNALIAAMGGTPVQDSVGFLEQLFNL